MKWNKLSRIKVFNLTWTKKDIGPVRFTFEEVLCQLKEAGTFLPIERFSVKALW